MTLLALACAKGSPGVTTLALTLAALLPPPAVLADLDPAGSDLLLRMDTQTGGPLDAEHGLLSLGAAVRRGGAALDPHLQVLAGGLQVLAGIATPEQGVGLGPVWPFVARTLHAHTGTVVADCGRLGAGPPTQPVLDEADAVVLVARSTVEHLSHLRDRVRALQESLRRCRSGQPVGVVVVAQERERSAAADVQRLLDAAALNARVLGMLAHDPKGALVLGGALAGRPGRTTLVRSARALVPAVLALAQGSRVDEVVA